MGKKSFFFYTNAHKRRILVVTIVQPHTIASASTSENNPMFVIIKIKKMLSFIFYI